MTLSTNDLKLTELRDTIKVHNNCLSGISPIDDSYRFYGQLVKGQGHSDLEH